MLTVIVFLPLLGALAVLLQRPDDERGIKRLSLAVTLVDLALAAVAYGLYGQGPGGLQFVEKVPWIPQFGVQYFLGVDGLSLPMVFLTALLFAAAVLVSWHIHLRPKEYFALLLILQTGVTGVFTALDLFLFFLFWEVELVPMYLLIAIWGTGRREYSAMKFLIYTIAGSAFMLAGILWLYFSAGLGTFDMLALANAKLALTYGGIIFLLIFVAFAIKLPMFPFHTWLPDAHVDAPTAVSVILAGILLKMGGYALIRINLSIFPAEFKLYAPYLAALAVVGVLYGGAVSLVQRDLKKLVAYSSVSHMGFVLLALAAMTPVALTGAVLTMFSHGVVTGLLFALVGVVYEQTHTRQIAEMGGLAHRMPFTATVFSLAGLAALGLPSMSGFVSEFTVFVGTYASTLFPQAQLFAVLATLGVVLGAGYILWMLERAFFGPLNPKYEHLADATFVQKVPLVALMAFVFLVGLWPAALTNVINPAILALASKL